MSSSSRTSTVLTVAAVTVVSGLVAYAVASVPNPPVASWRLLFLAEGLPSLALAAAIVAYLPSRPERSPYLSEPECVRGLLSSSGGDTSIDAE